MANGDDDTHSDEIEKAIEVATSRLDELTERAERALAPLYAAHTEMARTLMSLSSGAIVATITLVQYIQTRGSTSFASPAALKASWLLLALVDVLGVLRFYPAANAQAIRAEIEARRDAMGVKILKLEKGAVVSGTVKALEDALRESAQRVDSASRVTARLNVGMLTAFVLGVGALLDFAFVNFHA